jgi:hypothetical protein
MCVLYMRLYIRLTFIIFRPPPLLSTPHSGPSFAHTQRNNTNLAHLR